MADVILQADAEAEYEAAFDWYHGQSPLTAERFERSFDEALSAIAERAMMYPLIDGLHRSIGMGRFPYRLIYRVVGETIQVIAVTRPNRGPIDWASRG